MLRGDRLLSRLGNLTLALFFLAFRYLVEVCLRQSTYREQSYWANRANKGTAIATTHHRTYAHHGT